MQPRVMLGGIIGLEGILYKTCYYCHLFYVESAEEHIIQSVIQTDAHWISLAEYHNDQNSYPV
jgi:hypothetical protein